MITKNYRFMHSKISKLRYGNAQIIRKIKLKENKKKVYDRLIIKEKIRQLFISKYNLAYIALQY